VTAGVRTIGIEALTIDETRGQALPVSEAVLSAGGVIVENLGPGVGDHPEPLLRCCRCPAGGDGSLCGAVALLPRYEYPGPGTSRRSDRARPVVRT
jgi:kynurenine formamidase